jgi:hypothetical protein
MSCLGVHFAITPDEAQQLRSIPDEQARLDFIVENLEESYFKDVSGFKAESDKSWDAMHRALSNGELSWDGGSYPLNHAVLAGELLYTQDDYIMSLKTPGQVRDIAVALSSMTQEEFRRRYFDINPKTYDADLSEEDLDYTWRWLQGVRDLYARAAEAGRYVLFTADQ